MLAAGDTPPGTSGAASRLLEERVLADGARLSREGLETLAHFGERRLERDYVAKLDAFQENKVVKAMASNSNYKNVSKRILTFHTIQFGLTMKKLSS